MELEQAEIQQFRSIREAVIPFADRCIVLVGVNETGKTNILRALGMLARDARATPDDVRQLPSHEALNQPSRVTFRLRTTAAEREMVARLLRKPPFNFPEDFAVRLGAREVTLPELVDVDASELVYVVNVRTNVREWVPPRGPNDFAVKGEWLTPSTACPPNHQITYPRLGRTTAQNLRVIDAAHTPPEFGANHLRALESGDVHEMLWQAIARVADQNLPECISWSFTNDSPLPPTINFDEFAKRPASTPALRNIFRLAGYDDVGEAVREARERANGVRNLLDRVAKKVSSELHALWTDSTISIALSENGPLLECVVQDVHGAYDFARRSDGFRRFASFLLSVASRSRAGALQNALLLYDEPDTSLHPAAARQLRRELLRLAERNYVVYSTHSIFMIDAKNIGRHFIVRREKEETMFERARPSKIRDEEVLYQAVGHTLFAELGSNNLVLEGYRDRRLVEVALNDSRADAVRTTFDEMGICHAQGVKNIPAVTAMLDLIDRGCTIVTDSDTVATEARRRYDGKHAWLTYGELVDTSIVTAEDFVDVARINAGIERVAVDFPEVAAALPIAISASQPVLAQIELAFAPLKLSKQRKGDVMNALKTAVFDELEPQHLRPTAWMLLTALAARLPAR